MSTAQQAGHDSVGALINMAKAVWIDTPTTHVNARAEQAANAPMPVDTDLTTRVNGLEAKANGMDAKLDAILRALTS